jgi:nickel/cobalt transporter (NiCoT) family protein
MTENPSASDSPGAETHRTRAFVLCGALVVANIAAWIWALAAFGRNLELLGICAIVYGLGLRHAIDADHITAIDNVTRKMMQEDKRPVSVGFFFALGHSAIVILVTVVVALAAGSLGVFERLQGIGRVISTLVSASLLLAIAYMNVEIFLHIRRAGRRRADGDAAGGGDDALLAPAGLLSRLFRPILRLVQHSWHMLPLGLLFGLGFDTATEVAMFGVSTAQASKGLALTSVLVFPFLFTAGMSLVDTLDGVAMMQAYRWALITPDRRRIYNIAITLTSAVTAAVIGTVELVDLASDSLPLGGWVRATCSVVMSNVNLIGFALLFVFALAWSLSFLAAKGRWPWPGSGALRARRLP